MSVESAHLPARLAPRPDPPARLLRLASNERLVALVREGSEPAFEALFDRHRRPVLAFCRHMLGSPEEAEDAVQHTFMLAYRALLGSQQPVNLRPWLFTIARNRCLSVLRRRRERLMEQPPEPATEHLSAQVQRREDLRELLRDVANLPDDQRAALVLAEVGDVSHDEIAQVLGCPRPKVKSLVFQARTTLAASRDARAVPCGEIRDQLAAVRGGGLRRGPLRRHLRECLGCRAFKAQLALQRRALAIALPVLPTAALKASVLAGAFGGSGAGGGAAGAAGTAGAAGGAAALGTTAAGGGLAASGTLAAKALVVGAVAVGGATAGVEAVREHARPAPATRQAVPGAGPTTAAAPGGPAPAMFAGAGLGSGTTAAGAATRRSALAPPGAVPASALTASAPIRGVTSGDPAPASSPVSSAAGLPTGGPSPAAAVPVPSPEPVAAGDSRADPAPTAAPAAGRDQRLDDEQTVGVPPRVEPSRDASASGSGSGRGGAQDEQHGDRGQSRALPGAGGDRGHGHERRRAVDDPRAQPGRRAAVVPELPRAGDGREGRAHGRSGAAGRGRGEERGQGRRAVLPPSAGEVADGDAAAPAPADDAGRDARGRGGRAELPTVPPAGASPTPDVAPTPGARDAQPVLEEPARGRKRRKTEPVPAVAEAAEAAAAPTGAVAP